MLLNDVALEELLFNSWFCYAADQKLERPWFHAPAIETCWECGWSCKICYQEYSVSTLGCMSRVAEHLGAVFWALSLALVWKLTYCMVYAIGVTVALNYFVFVLRLYSYCVVFYPDQYIVVVCPYCRSTWSIYSRAAFTFLCLRLVLADRTVF
jgi:hypothetical protein